MEGTGAVVRELAGATGQVQTRAKKKAMRVLGHAMGEASREQAMQGHEGVVGRRAVALEKANLELETRLCWAYFGSGLLRGLF